MKKHFIKIVAICLLITAPLGVSLAQSDTLNTIDYQQLSDNLSHKTNLTPKAIEMAFAGYKWALNNASVKNKDILTIVDFSVSSAKERLYVINVKTGNILMAMAVAHGKNSGKGVFATNFSKEGGALTSRIGVFLTMNSYHGHHGLSLRINGLEDSNKIALSHNVVVHPANYVTPEFIKQHGRAGNSWGCFAVNPKQSEQLINYIKDNSVLYAYGPSSEYTASTKII